MFINNSDYVFSYTPLLTIIIIRYNKYYITIDFSLYRNYTYQILNKY